MTAVVLLGGIAGAIASACAIYFAWSSMTSQGIVFGTAAFVGAFILLILQMLLELRHETLHDLVTAEYTHDRSLPEIASAFYSDEHPGSIRAFVEKEASARVAVETPDYFFSEPAQLAQDMALFSLVSMLFNYQSDWQLKPEKLVPRYTFGMTTSKGLSSPDQCSRVSKEHFAKELRRAGSPFAIADFAQLGRSDICLPPHSTIRIKPNSLQISTPSVSLTFSVRKPTGFLGGIPKLIDPLIPRTFETALTEDGLPRYSNMPLTIDISVDLHALYAAHRNTPRMREWVSRVTDATHAWFEGTGDKYHGYKSPLERNIAP